jgi:hypothetical protein
MKLAGDIIAIASMVIWICTVMYRVNKEEDL